MTKVNLYLKILVTLQKVNREKGFKLPKPYLKKYQVCTVMMTSIEIHNL